MIVIGLNDLQCSSIRNILLWLATCVAGGLWELSSIDFGEVSWEVINTYMSLSG